VSRPGIRLARVLGSPQPTPARRPLESLADSLGPRVGQDTGRGGTGDRVGPDPETAPRAGGRNGGGCAGCRRRGGERHSRLFAAVVSANVSPHQTPAHLAQWHDWYHL